MDTITALAGWRRFPVLLFFLQLALVPAFGQGQAIRQRFVVAQDGSGDFTTIQEAVNAVRDHSQVRAVIEVKRGIYHEKVVIPSWKKNILIRGEDREQTIITHDDYSGKRFDGTDFTGNKVYTTYTSYTVLVQADDCMLENLTIRNTSGPVGQAVALHIEGDRSEIVGCLILGYQDTLYAAKGRQYYRDCTVAGTTDFIFGEATAVFSGCTIRSLRNSYITAASTSIHQSFGFVFFNCRLVAEEGVDKVYLGRPWRPYAKTVFIECSMGPHITKAGWDPWNGDAFFPGKEQTVFYAEYGNQGPGADTAMRVAWSHQLSYSHVSRYTLDTIFGGWQPSVLARPRAGVTGVADTSFTAAKEMARLRANYPEIRFPDSSALQCRTIPYHTAADGTVLYGDVYAAKASEGPVPAILVLFGGGWRSGDRKQLGTLAGRLADSGFTCIAIDYRLSTHARYPAAVRDVKAALGWLRTESGQLGILPDQIAVMGFSAGGQLAALVGTMEGDGVKAIIDIDGILAFLHPESGEGRDSNGTSAATHWFGYTRFERPDLWQEASALSYVSERTPPVLFINSSVERMHAGRDDFIRVLDRYGIGHRTKVFPDAPHAFCLFEPWFTPMVDEIAGFLKKIG